MSNMTVRTELRTTRAWTALLAVVAVGHHLGTLLAGLGTVGVVQVADLVDLLLPYAVVATGAVALLGVPRGPRIAGVVGLVLYVQGHGIHLAANSIAERQHSPTAFFWDELADTPSGTPGCTYCSAHCSSAGPCRPDPGRCGWC